VPKYLLLGKGLAMSREDLDYSLAQSAGTMTTTSADQIGLALSGDYHNGPLSVVIPFGIWGVAGFLWFLAAGLRVLYKNFKYGDESLRIVNSCLFAMFTARTVMFIFLAGGFHSDLQTLIGSLGFNICLNGGVAKPAPAPVPKAAEESGFAGMLPRPRSAGMR
jgi:hypothetical protein